MRVTSCLCRSTTPLLNSSRGNPPFDTRVLMTLQPTRPGSLEASPSIMVVRHPGCDFHAGNHIDDGDCWCDPDVEQYQNMLIYLHRFFEN